MLATPDHKIFLIDEDEAVRDSLKVLLDSHSVQVRDFRTVAEFLAVDTVGQGDCLVLGYNCLGVEGLDLIQALRRRGFTLPIIFIAGGGDATTRPTALAAGAFAYLERPVDEATLVRAIKAALTRKGTRPWPVGDTTAPEPMSLRS